MSIINITKATRKGAHIIIALYGYSGSGKTLSALLLARGLAGEKGKVCMLDTETGRGLIYAQAIPGGYDYAELTSPFTPERYVEALQEVEKAGYDVLVIDSSSHCWEGIGGVLEMAEATGAEGLLKWAAPKARHKKWVKALLQSRMHILLCVRAKEKLVQTGKGRDAKIASAGMVPIQEKGFVFETTVQLFMHHEVERRATYTVEKCPGDLLAAFPDGQKITIETGRRIAEWVAGGVPVDHGLEALKREGEAIAESGTAEFTAWWNSAAVKPKRPALRSHLDNFKSIALAADDEERQQPGMPQSEIDPDDPFAAGPTPSRPPEIRHVGGEAWKVERVTKAPPSPLTLKGKAREAAWPAFSGWLAKSIEALPANERQPLLDAHGKEWTFIRENRPGDEDAITAALDAPERAPSQAAE